MKQAGMQTNYQTCLAVLLQLPAGERRTVKGSVKPTRCLSALFLPTSCGGRTDQILWDRTHHRPKIAVNVSSARKITKVFDADCGRTIVHHVCNRTTVPSGMTTHHHHHSTNRRRGKQRQRQREIGMDRERETARQTTTTTTDKARDWVTE